MPVQTHDTYYQIRAIDRDGSMMTNQEKRTELNRGVFIWKRWGIGVGKLINVRVAGEYGLKTYSARFDPKSRTVWFNLSWDWPYGSIPKVFAHELGHSFGLWTNGHHPVSNGKWSHIMSIGAGGVYGQLHYSEARWIVGKCGLNTSANYHPLVAGYKAKLDRARNKWTALTVRIQQASITVRRLRAQNQSVGLSRDEVAELRQAVRVRDNCSESRDVLSEQWGHWKRTVDGVVLEIARGYGSVHQAMLPEQASKSLVNSSGGKVAYAGEYAGSPDAMDVIECVWDLEAMGE